MKRNNDFIKSYYESDMNQLGVKRFPAILGKTVDFNTWLTPEAIEELNITELTKERTHHYQLTYGGVGCFLSHYMLAKQLLSDDNTDYYIICEDDIIFYKNMIESINYYLSEAPNDWDIIHFITSRKINYKVMGMFFKPKGFWGTQCYIINKQGAKKIVGEVHKEKIDAQIDAYLSRMIQQNKINIYITNKNLVVSNTNGNISDIQYNIKRMPSQLNPYNYKGYIV
jgi:GR25 family glycosyltransferase involved in LPS biosynthesis